VNTSRQIGGAVGIAAISAIAATATGNYADAHVAVSTTSPVALDHGFQAALYALTGLLVVGIGVAVTLVKPAPAPAAAAPAEAAALREAA
jgi:hypothetical protein